MKNESEKIKIADCDVYIGDTSLRYLPAVLTKLVSSFDAVYILTDSSAKKHVLPLLKKSIPQLKDKNIITIKSGEHNKQLTTCELIWDKLTKLGADRYSLLINIGGGAISDLGGFVASTYMRGIKYINVPTTLLAMVDASVGGKVGVDFKGLKNHIGAFSIPKAVFVCPKFLSTLNRRLMLCGFAEMLKHALIIDKKYWNELKELDLKNKNNWHQLIKRSIEIKKEITENDPEEKNLRKLLNFGHTAGHALEAYCIEKRVDLLHGEAVAWGMIVEAHLSFKDGKLSLEALEEITSTIKKYYRLEMPISKSTTLINIMRSDKKNKSGKINFTLLNGIGSSSIDYHFKDKQIKEAIEYANGQF